MDENNFVYQKEKVIDLGKGILEAIDKIQFILLHEIIKMDNYNRLIDNCFDNDNFEMLYTITNSNDYKKTFELPARESEAHELIEDGRKAMKNLADLQL